MTAIVQVSANQAGFTVNASSGQAVVLRNLQLFSTAANTVGIQHNGGNLFVDDVSFTGLTAGINSGSSGRSTLVRSRFVDNVTGLNVTAGRWSVADTDFTGNSDAIHATGDGGANNNPISGTTMVRVDGGTITDNEVAFHMTNAGMKPGGGCNGQNIFIRTSNGGDRSPNAIGNTKYALPDGTTETIDCGGFFNIGTYNPGTSGTP